MNIREWNPAEGQAYQGDVSIVPVPKTVKIATIDEIKPVGGRLILQEGEATGHHHAIALADPRAKNFRREGEANVAGGDPFAGASPAIRKKLSGGAKAKVATAKLYRDADAASRMVSAGILDRSDLVTGFLVVEGGPVVLRHEEHDGIRIPEGRYCIGRQVESVGAEERAVQD